MKDLISGHIIQNGQHRLVVSFVGVHRVRASESGAKRTSFMLARQKTMIWRSSPRYIKNKKNFASGTCWDNKALVEQIEIRNAQDSRPSDQQTFQSKQNLFWSGKSHWWNVMIWTLPALCHFLRHEKSLLVGTLWLQRVRMHVAQPLHCTHENSRRCISNWYRLIVNCGIRTIRC